MWVCFVVIIVALIYLLRVLCVAWVALSCIYDVEAIQSANRGPLPRKAHFNSQKEQINPV